MVSVASNSDGNEGNSLVTASFPSNITRKIIFPLLSALFSPYVNPLQNGTIPIWCRLIQDLWKPECGADLYDDFESMKNTYEIFS